MHQIFFLTVVTWLVPAPIIDLLCLQVFVFRGLLLNKSFQLIPTTKHLASLPNALYIIHKYHQLHNIAGDYLRLSFIPNTVKCKGSIWLCLLSILFTDVEEGGGGEREDIHSRQWNNQWWIFINPASPHCTSTTVHWKLHFTCKRKLKSILKTYSRDLFCYVLWGWWSISKVTRHSTATVGLDGILQLKL